MRIILGLFIYLIGFISVYGSIRKSFLNMSPTDIDYCTGWNRVFKTFLFSLFWPILTIFHLIILLFETIKNLSFKEPPKWLILICLISFISCSNKKDKEYYSILTKEKDPVTNNMCSFLS